jgi:citrate lyase subunit beta/citryl-CoA lyase
VNGLPARSYLFVPADRPDRYRKALDSGADAVIIDLEDAVAADAKAAARAALTAWAAAEPALAARVWIRINDQATPWFEADLALLRGIQPAGAMLPKAENAAQVAAVAAALPPPAGVIALIETARGVHQVEAVACAPRVARLAFGTLDYALDLDLPDLADLAGSTGMPDIPGTAGSTGSPGLPDMPGTAGSPGLPGLGDTPRMSGVPATTGLPGRSPGIQHDWRGLAYPASRIAIASRLAGLPPPIAGVTAAINDPQALLADFSLARACGFGAKLCIHPSQVTTVHQALAPTPEQERWAMRVVAALESGQGAARIDGRMVDRPVFMKARALLARRSRSEPALSTPQETAS